MRLETIFATALKAILINKSRSFLTMLGVIIGVGSVVLLTSIGTGLKSYVEEQFQSLGSNTLYVVPGNPFAGGGSQDAIVERTKATLKRSYLNQILRNNRDTITRGMATGLSTAEAKYQTTTKRVTLYGISGNYEKIQHTIATKGAWFTDADESSGKHVVLLGPKIAEELFGQSDPINKKLKLDGQSYTVVGVLEEKGGGFGGPNFDNYVYIPLSTLFDNFNTDIISSFVFEVRDKAYLAQAKSGITQLLLKDLKEDEFTVFDQSQLLERITSILNILTAGLGGIAAISLVVGGIGIMNIMLVSVTERTREIGLRKALGATPNIILTQFLIEATLLSGIGGLIGIGLAFIGTAALQSFFPARILLSSIGIAFGVSSAVGILFGAAPARRAAQLSPIEALRSE